MELASIRGDTVLMLYHPAEALAEVGQQFTILEVPDQREGLVIQVISNESLDYVGLQQEMIQRILEERVAQSLQVVLDRERGMGEMRNIKLARAKIRRRIAAGEWLPWDGWIPTRNVAVTRLEGADVLRRILPDAVCPLRTFAQFNGTPVRLDGPRLNMVNVIAGVKGSGKSHLAKHLVLALAEVHVPCIVFDINGEYTVLPGAQVLRWGDNFVPDLAEVGHETLRTVVQATYPLPDTSANAFESMLPVVFGNRRQFCEQRHEPFTIDIDFLRQAHWSGNQHVNDAIRERLRVVGERRLFRVLAAPGVQPGQARPGLVTTLTDAYNQACAGATVVFDMRTLPTALRQALVRFVNRTIETICETEGGDQGQGRYPFVFFEEAHFYVSKEAILNIITRGRHIGMGSVFITNTPQDLPDSVFRQLDNLLLLALTHRDDIKNVSKNSFTDEDTIESFATRMPEFHALVMGNVTQRYPLVLRIDPLPANVPATGRTRSTWDRFTGNQTGPGR